MAVVTTREKEGAQQASSPLPPPTSPILKPSPHSDHILLLTHAPFATDIGGTLAKIVCFSNLWLP